MGQKEMKDLEALREDLVLLDYRECQDHQGRKERVGMLAQWGLQDSRVHTVLKGQLGERAHLECLVESDSLDLLERRVMMEKLETLDQLESLALLVPKAMSEKRGILVLPVQLAPLDPEEHQEKTDPKATLVLLDSLEMQGPLVSLVSRESMVHQDLKEIVEIPAKQDRQGLQESLVLQDHLEGGAMSVLQEKKESKA